MSRTDELFTFELDLGAGEGCMTEEGLEDTVYNCLDFCLLYGKTPHFYLGGEDPIRHPALWTVLELLREEGASFSSSYILRAKIRASEYLMMMPELSLEQIAATLGFSSQSHFGQVFKRFNGITPGVYREQHQRQK